MLFAPRVFSCFLSACALICSAVAPAHAAAPANVGCQGRIMPLSRPIRLAAPADQGTPIIAALYVEEGGVVPADGVVAVLAAAGPAKILREQAAQQLATAQAEHDALPAAQRLEILKNKLDAIDAQTALATARAELAAAEIQANRQRLDADGVRALEARLAAAVSARNALQANRPALQAKLEATVQTAQTQAKEASGAERRIAQASLAEAEAGRALALREHEVRVAAATGEIAVLQAQLAQGKSLHTQVERQPGEIEALKTQESLATARVATLTEWAALTATRHESDTAVARAKIEEVETALQLAEKRLALTSVRSPLKGGTVLRVFARPGEAVGPEGVAEIADLSQMAVEAEVSVADITRVKAGQNATVRVPGLEQSFSGKVTRLGLRAGAGSLLDENPAAFKDLRVIPVVITLDDTAALAGHTGAQVTVRIHADETAAP